MTCLRLPIVLLAVLMSTLARADDAKPNVLFIAIDDQNDWIGCLGGHPQVQTPHIDRLAARGTLFTNAHCQSPLCNSSRTSLMTGLRPSTTGIYGLVPWFRDLEKWKDVVSLPQYLAEHGYRTYSGGKIYHGRYGRPNPRAPSPRVATRGLAREFDEYGPPSSVGAKPPHKLVETPNPHPLVDWGVFPHKDEDKGDWKVASWAVETLKEDLPQPFFLAAGFFLPHVPCYATQKWFDLYPEDALLLPPVRHDDRDDTPRFSWYLHWKLPEPRLKYLEEGGQWSNLVRSYLACTSFVDSQVGRILDALEQSGHAENTIVVLWSDHGWHLGEKLITGKNSLWDRSTRVPLIFAGLGVSAGARCHQPVELLDIYPTLADLCGLPPQEELEGHSLVPQLERANTLRPWPAITTHNQNNHGLRTARWRYIRYADGSEELYDMQIDPNEFDNLATNSLYGDVIADLRGQLPQINAHAAPGSKHRILLYDEGEPNWEGEAITPDAPIPGL